MLELEQLEEGQLLSVGYSPPKYSIRILSNLCHLTVRRYRSGHRARRTVDGTESNLNDNNVLKPPEYTAFNGIGWDWTGFEKRQDNLIFVNSTQEVWDIRAMPAQRGFPKWFDGYNHRCL